MKRIHTKVYSGPNKRRKVQNSGINKRKRLLESDTKNNDDPKNKKHKSRHLVINNRTEHKCVGKSQSECKTSGDTCQWIQYTTKKGTKVRYCRRKSQMKKKSKKRKRTLCSGKSQSECKTSGDTCQWIQYTTKKGTNVRYCRRKSPRRRSYSPNKKHHV